MAATSLSSTTLPSLPSPHLIIPYLSLSPYPRSTASSIRGRLRRKPPLDFKMSGSISILAMSLRRVSDSDPLLDSPCITAAGKGDVMASTTDKESSKTYLHKNIYSTDSMRLFGVDLTADNIAVAMVYFVQGVLGLSRLAVNFYLKDDLHLDPAEVLLVTGLNRKLGVSDEWFAIGDSLVLTVLGQVSFMPVLVLAAKICPEGMEATLFATLISISNGGGVLGGLIGAGLTQLFGVTKDEFGNLAALIIFCYLSSMIPLPLLGLLPQDISYDEPEGNADIETK